MKVCEWAQPDLFHELCHQMRSKEELNNIEYPASFKGGNGYILVLVPLAILRVYDVSLEVGRCLDRYSNKKISSKSASCSTVQYLDRYVGSNISFR